MLKELLLLLGGINAIYGLKKDLFEPILQQQYHVGKNGEYKFGFQSNVAARDEVRGSDGITRGYYTYTDDKGQIQYVFYTAGDDGYKVHATNPPTEIAKIQSAHVTNQLASDLAKKQLSFFHNNFPDSVASQNELTRKTQSSYFPLQNFEYNNKRNRYLTTDVHQRTIKNDKTQQKNWTPSVQYHMQSSQIHFLVLTTPRPVLHNAASFPDLNKLDTNINLFSGEPLKKSTAFNSFPGSRIADITTSSLNNQYRLIENKETQPERFDLFNNPNSRSLANPENSVSLAVQRTIQALSNRKNIFL